MAAISTWQFEVVDAFTAVPFAGNPACIVLLAEEAAWPSDKALQAFARSGCHQTLWLVAVHGNLSCVVFYIFHLFRVLSLSSCGLDLTGSQ